MTLLTTGKRQRRDELSDHQLRDSERGSRSRDDEGDEGDDELQAHVFRAHFEARFAPLEVAHSKLSDDDERMDARECACDEFESECDSEAGWGGISDEEGEEEKMAVNVVEYQSAEARTGAKVLQGEFKRFMSSRPPSSRMQVALPNRRPTEMTDPDEAATEEANLKNDIALQRLLRESHLLDPQSTLSLAVQNRRQALDLRLQEVGSKTSIHAQRKMPMAQRKGIAQKARGREERRRQEAKQNGIILEAPAKRKFKNEGKRQRSVGNPSVGRFQGGMLKLSKRDVAEIEGPKRRRRK